MAGATLRDRVVACFGTFFGIWIAVFAASSGGFDGVSFSLLAAPIGASAVLVFAVPSSPLAQPWSVIGGNGLSAVTGLLVTTTLQDPVWAAATAVAFAILVMTLTRSLHPPGGACALTVTIAHTYTPDHVVPVMLLILLNSIGLVAAAWLFHRLQRRTYPHRAPLPAVASDLQPLFHQDDISAAVLEMGDAFDVTEADLKAIFERAAHNAERRLGR
jgi:CBS domain-containing membrane protein